MSMKTRVVAIIYLLTIGVSIRLYPAIKGSTIYKTTTEIFTMLAIALVIATIITIVYLKLQKKRH